ncbi:hypothetical protein [Kitasatospora sp. NPDC001175]|uniref:hypothetical protein n=1 Tax=Kitasatospora sp. NPDC001175 TaxID=3157103 RepID=UPI003D08B8C0
MDANAADDDASWPDTDPAAGSALPDGPPWRAAGGIPGPARGKSLNPPNKRHFLAGVKRGRIREANSVVLRGYEEAVGDDVALIAAGHARFNAWTHRYEINGRSYGVEENGTVFPDAGVGIVNMNRNEYAALAALARAGGASDQVPEFTRDPRFRDNPQAIATAQAVYDGTYK